MTPRLWSTIESILGDMGTSPNLIRLYRQRGIRPDRIPDLIRALRKRRVHFDVLALWERPPKRPQGRPPRS